MAWNLLESFDTEANFWEINKQLKVMSPFSDLYKNDKSKNKQDSSKLMWGVALAFDPNSKYHNFPEKDRATLVAKDWFIDKSFDWDKYKDLTKQYMNCFLTPTERSMRAFKNKIDERERLLEQYPYTIDNAKMLDDIITNTDKIMKVIDYLEKKLGTEDSSGATVADREESAVEKGLI